MKTKKILSLLIVLALTFSFMTVTNVQAAHDEFAILKTLGIAADFSDNTTPITRYQLAEVALQLTGSSPEANGTPVYPDIPVKHKYFPVINAVTNKGLMGPTMDGSFAPDALASAMDGGRMLLAELGYGGFAKQADWTELQYVSKVKSLGLTSGVDTSEGLTYYAIGKMIINMLTLNTLEVSSVDTDGIKYTESSISYIESKYGYVLKTGVLQAAGSTSMSGYATLATNRVSIDGVKYSTTGSDYSQFVGYNVKYILSSKYSDAKVLHVEPYRGFEELVISAKDISSVALSGSNYVISYVDENEKEETVSFKNSARIVFNGQNVTDSSKTLKYLKPDIGKVTLVDTDSDYTYDIAHVESMIYYKAGAVSVKNISDQFTKNSLSLEDKDVYVYKNGVGADIASIESGSYVEIATGDVDFTTINGNEIVVPKLATSEKISINAINTTTLKGTVNGILPGKVSIDGTLYEYNAYFFDLISSGYVKSLALNDVAEVALNEAGEIIDIISTTSDYSVGDNSKLKYGYMLNMAGVSQISDQAVVKFVDIVELKEYTIVTSEDCKLNDKDFDYQELLAVDPTTTATALYYADGTTFKEQLIRYELNADGEICRLYLAVDHANPTIILPETSYNPATDGSHPFGKPSTYVNPDYDPEYIGYDNNNFSLDFMDMAWGHTKVANDLYEAVDGETIILKIPTDPAEKANLLNWQVYTQIKDNVGMVKAFGYSADMVARLELYDVSELYVPAVAINREPAKAASVDNKTFNESKRTGVVTSMVNVYDENANEIKTQVTLTIPTPAGLVKKVYTPTRNNLPMATGYTYMNADGSTVGGANLPGSNTDPNAAIPRVLWTDLKIGDIVQIEVNTAGEAYLFCIYARNDIVNNMSYFGNIACASGNITLRDGKFLFGYYTNVDVGYVTKAMGADGFLMNIEGPTGSVAGMQFIRKLNDTTGGGISSEGASMTYYAGTTRCEASYFEDIKVGDRVIVHHKMDHVVEVFVIK